MRNAGFASEKVQTHGYLLRRPTLHPCVDGNSTMRREMRVLAGLRNTEVPHAGVIGGCEDIQVLGSVFYLMEPVEGFNACAQMPALHAGDAAVRQAMGLALADGAATLGRLDLEAVGLSDLGKLDGRLERQVPCWTSQLETYGQYPGWSGAAVLGDVAGIGRWLEEQRPTSFVPGMMHGDYHLANVMFRNDGPALAAIVDWEMTTAGDPLLDLGWMLATWPDESGVSAGPIAPKPWAGFVYAQALVERYALGSQRNLEQVDCYAVLACYKLGIVLEGSHAKACAGKPPRAVGDQLHAAAQHLL